MRRDHTRPHFNDTGADRSSVDGDQISRMEKAKTRLPGLRGGDIGANRKLSNSSTAPEKPKTLELTGASEFKCKMGLKNKRTDCKLGEGTAGPLDQLPQPVKLGNCLHDPNRS